MEVEYLTEAEIKARLAGIAAARAQLVAQRDTVSDERRNGLAMAAIGAVATLLTIRRPFGILGMIAAVAGTATVWGIIQFLGAQRNLNTLNEHLAKLTEERKEYEALDGSVRSMLNKGLARLRIRPAEIGKTLSGALAGCRELKFRADGLRVIYRIRDGQVQIVDILAIGARDHDRAFRDAERRLGDEG